MSSKRNRQRDDVPVVTPFPARKNATPAGTSPTCRALRMLHAEHQSMIELLHDDLGQNLVAIRSFAAAIAEKHTEDGGDTAELASMIDAAAEAAYCRSYGLMQELRAQQAADGGDLHMAVDECLREARLRENEIDCRWRIDPAVGELDRDTRALVLRNIRGFANFCKSLGRCERISVDLQPALGRSDCHIDLALGYTGSFEQLDSDDPVLKSIAERTIAIGGEMLLGCDARSGCFTLNLYFDPLLTDCSKPA